jgi:hypothetical protein
VTRNINQCEKQCANLLINMWLWNWSTFALTSIHKWIDNFVHIYMFPCTRAGRNMRKMLPPPGFDPRTVQAVASSYTDYATRPTVLQHTRVIFTWLWTLELSLLMYACGAVCFVCADQTNECIISEEYEFLTSVEVMGNFFWYEIQGHVLQDESQLRDLTPNPAFT